MTKVERKTRCPLTISGLGGRALENRIPRWSGEIRVDENLGGGGQKASSRLETSKPLWQSFVRYGQLQNLFTEN